MNDSDSFFLIFVSRPLHCLELRVHKYRTNPTCPIQRQHGRRAHEKDHRPEERLVENVAENRLIKYGGLDAVLPVENLRQPVQRENEPEEEHGVPVSQVHQDLTMVDNHTVDDQVDSEGIGAH